MTGTDDPLFTLRFLEATYAAGYDHGVRDAHAAADREAVANHQAAVRVVQAMTDAPVLTPVFLTGTSDELTTAAIERVETKRREVLAANQAARNGKGAA
ncbi:hypothetical protein IEE94_11420 [Yimella sp. cx-573]|nr:hypothetical protein [Yimella sp. cx-573]